MRLQWKEIRNVVHKKYEKTYDKETFEVLLTRVLKHLFQSGYVKKDIRGHQEVYYFIPKRRRKVIIDELNRRFMHKKLDEIWERLSSEQRKKAVESLIQRQGLLLQAENHFFKTVLEGLRDLGSVYLSELNKPQMNVRKELSSEKKQELSRQLDTLEKECIKIESNMEKEALTIKENWKEHLELSFEFLNKVVDPLYNGNGLEAIQGLMRKAIAEQDSK